MKGKNNLRGVPQQAWVRLTDDLYFSPIRFLPAENSREFCLSPDQELFEAASAASHTKAGSGGSNGVESSSPSAAALRSYRFFNLDPHIDYDSLNADFGPVSLGCFIQAFHEIERVLQRKSNNCDGEENTRPLVLFCNQSCYAVHNAACIVAAFAVIVLDVDPARVKSAFATAPMPDLLPFRDAAVGYSTFDMMLEDVVDAFVLARRHRWLPKNWRDFDVAEYERMSAPEVADANVIVPGLFVAFAGPEYDSSSTVIVPRGGVARSVSRMLPFFSKLSVRLVVRLNEPPLYSDQEFNRNGISTWHPSVPLPDGGVPPDSTVRAFFDACATVFDNFACGPEPEEAELSDAEKKRARNDALLFKHLKKKPQQQQQHGEGGDNDEAAATKKKKTVRGCVAVHCRQGFGRTGTMIALYLMYRYRARAREVIAWIRLCRPGSILGPQQSYLITAESRLLASLISMTPPSNLLKKVVPRKRQTVSADVISEIEAVTSSSSSSSASPDANHSTEQREKQKCKRNNTKSMRGVPSVFSDSFGAVANAAMLRPRPATGSLRAAGLDKSSIFSASSSSSFSGAQQQQKDRVPIPELRAQSSLSLYTTGGTATAAASEQRSSAMLSKSRIAGADCMHRASSTVPAAAAAAAAAGRSFSSAAAATPTSEASWKLASVQGVVTAPFSSFRVGWSSPLAPNVVNEEKSTAYRVLGATTNGASKVLPRVKPRIVTRVFGGSAAAVRRNSCDTAETSLGAAEQSGRGALGLTKLLGDSTRARQLFTPVPL